MHAHNMTGDQGPKETQELPRLIRIASTTQDGEQVYHPGSKYVTHGPAAGAAILTDVIMADRSYAALDALASATQIFIRLSDGNMVVLWAANPVGDNMTRQFRMCSTYEPEVGRPMSLEAIQKTDLQIGQPLAVELETGGLQATLATMTEVVTVNTLRILDSRVYPTFAEDGTRNDFDQLSRRVGASAVSLIAST